MKTHGNTVLITGGGSGIGFAFASALLAAGNTVIACGRNAGRLEQARQRLPGLHTIVCDVSRSADRDHLFAEVSRHFPQLNVLINNAGSARQLDFAGGAPGDDALEEDVAVNLLAPAALASRFLPMLLKQPGAAIVNVSAVLAYAPIASLPLHSASKAALRSFTRSLRRQLAHLPIRVIEVVPPVVDTAMQRDIDVPKVAPDRFVERVLARIAAGDDDVHVGQAKVFRLAARVAPEALFGMLNRTVERSSPASGQTQEVAHAGA
jgi:uncharacterized oxidoreductase